MAQRVGTGDTQAGVHGTRARQTVERCSAPGASSCAGPSLHRRVARSLGDPRAGCGGRLAGRARDDGRGDGVGPDVPGVDLLLPGRGGGGLTPGLLTLAVVGVMQMLLYPLLYCVLTVAYYDLRVRKEGFDLEVLASTLQPA